MLSQKYIGVGVACQLVMELYILSTDVRKILKYQFHRKSDLWEPSCAMLTVGHTDKPDEGNSRSFCDFAIAPKPADTLVVYFRKKILHSGFRDVTPYSLVGFYRCCGRGLSTPLPPVFTFVLP